MGLLNRCLEWLIVISLWSLGWSWAGVWAGVSGRCWVCAGVRCIDWSRMLDCPSEGVGGCACGLGLVGACVP